MMHYTNAVPEKNNLQYRLMILSHVIDKEHYKIRIFLREAEFLS